MMVHYILPSNGHVGMGGLDIFKSELDDNGIYVSAINLKSPINSSADDFGMIVERKSERGYFTSNRKTWTGTDGVVNKSNGSDNIYQFELPPLVLVFARSNFRLKKWSCGYRG